MCVCVCVCANNVAFRLLADLLGRRFDHNGAAQKSCSTQRCCSEKLLKPLIQSAADLKPVERLSKAACVGIIPLLEMCCGCLMC